MSRKRVESSGDSSAIRIPQEVLDQMGVQAGEEVEMSVVDRTLILRPLPEAERQHRIEEITENTLERRKSAYQELAKGVE